MLYAKCEGGRRTAEKGLTGRCPGCDAELRPKCGLVRPKHWAHVAGDCDPWSEPESEWHVTWKKLADVGNVEVAMPPHRADIVGPDRTVVELQHSHLPAEDIRAREAFYGRMIWLFDASAFIKNVSLVPVVLKGESVLAVRWKHSRPTQKFATSQLFWDPGPSYSLWQACLGKREDASLVDRILQVTISSGDSRYGFARSMSRASFVDAYIRRSHVEFRGVQFDDLSLALEIKHSRIEQAPVWGRPFTEEEFDTPSGARLAARRLEWQEFHKKFGNWLPVALGMSVKTATKPMASAPTSHAAGKNTYEVPF